MKKIDDEGLDDLFSKGLNDSVDAEYREADWDAFEGMLDTSKRQKGIIFWLPILSAAAVLLIAFYWWEFRPTANDHPSKLQPRVVVQPRKGAGKDSVIAKNTPGGSNAGQDSLVAQNIHSGSSVKPGKDLSAQATVRQGVLPVRVAPSPKAVPQIAVNKLAADTNRLQSTVLVPFERPEALNLTAANAGLSAEALPGKQNVYAVALQKNTPAAVSAKGNAARHNKAVTGSGFLAHPTFALSFLGAPELNGVNSFQQSRSGTNFGVLLSVGVLKKVTISTGTLYSYKPYNTYFGGSYSSTQYRPGLTSINANCRVLDIPVNVDYQFYNKHLNKLSIGSGLSSYIMLHENYQYNYANPAVNSPFNYTVPNANKYFFGILNLQATYTRQVNAKVGLSVSPYMKLPLTGIGANSAKLQTTGVAIGLNWNLISLSKP